MEEQTTEQTTNEKKLKAKSTSLIGQIFAALWFAGWSAYKFVFFGDFILTTSDRLLTPSPLSKCVKITERHATTINQT